MMSGDYVRIIKKLQEGKYCDLDEVKYVMGANRDLFAQARTIADRITGEVRQESYVDPYRFAQDELYKILKKNNRLEKGEH